MSQPITPTGAPIQTCEDDEQCEVLSCDQCLDEIPPSLADNPEAPDYVAHYCGLNCLAQWQKEQAEQAANADAADPVKKDG